MCEDCNDELITLIDLIEEDLKVSTMLNQFQLGIALKVIEDRLWRSNNAILAQRCNAMQHKLLDKEDKKDGK